MSNDTDIRPALTAEEWAMAPKVYFRQPRHFECKTPGCYCHNGKGHSGDEGYGVEVVSDGTMGVWDDSWGVTVAKENRHALAALALHKQPFGFTHDDVALLNWHASMQHSVGLYINEDRLRSIADRIAALLPPNEHQLPSSDDASAGGGKGGSV